MIKIELNEMDIALIKTSLHRYKDCMKDMMQTTDDPYPFEVYGWVIRILNDIKTQTK
tara:strand:+ start:298 stop:468 length:171 start_codon:yes stop_codon:yes gene_type:complete